MDCLGKDTDFSVGLIAEYGISFCVLLMEEIRIRGCAMLLPSCRWLCGGIISTDNHLEVIPRTEASTFYLGGIIFIMNIHVIV